MDQFGGWRRLYLHFLSVGPAVRQLVPELLDRAVTNGSYYSGSLYDVPLVATVAVDGGGRLVGTGMGSEKPSSSVSTRDGRK